VTLKGQTRDPNTLRAQISRKLLELETTNLVCRFESGVLEWHCIALLCWCAVKKLLTHSLESGVPSGRTNNYPESGH